MKNTVFTQYNLSESWCTEQSNARSDDIKTVLHRPLRCVIAIPSVSSHLARHVSVGEVCLSLIRKKYALETHVNYERVTLNTTHKSEMSNSAAFIAETNHVMWNLFMSTISHGRTIVYMMVSAIEASKKAVGYSF